MPRKNFPAFEKVEITDAGAEGKAVARVNNLVIFVPYAAPGDLVDLKIIRKKKAFCEGRIVKIHQHSTRRTEPFCSHFGLCGGCTWQHLQYHYQAEYKKKQVADAFERIGKFDFPEIPPVIRSAATIHYRNKLEYTFSNRRWLTDPSQSVNNEKDMYGLGFHLPGIFDRIIDIDTCYLQPEPSNSIRLAAKKFALENDYTFYDQRHQKGFLRNLLIRNSSSGEVMVILVASAFEPEKINGLLAHLRSEFEAITSLYYIINPKSNDTISDLEPVLFEGKADITETMGELSFRVGPLSFYQTNSQQAFELYKIAKDFAALQRHEVVYDLYTGAGTIANFVARSALKVVGLEYVNAAVKDAFLNSSANNIQNTHFVAGDILKELNDEFVSTHGHPHIIITDPPRAGMHPGVVAKIDALSPDKIVYISCNPATQARDIALLTQSYHVEKMQPVDMFPHTSHIENVALLKRNH